MMSLDVVVVAHNSLEELRHLVDSLWPNETIAQASQHLIIVDSGSEDPAALRGVPARHRCAIENHGYGTAANVGLRLSRADWVALLNPDTRIAYSDLVRLAGVAGRDQLAIVAPRLKDQHGVDIPHFQDLPKPIWRRREQQVSSPGESHESVTITSIRGAVMVMRRELVVALGGFDEDFFLYGEEIDLATRVWASGGTVGYVPLVIAVHQSEGSSGAISAGWRSAQRTRGKARYVRKRYGYLAAVISICADIYRQLRKDRGTRVFWAYLSAVSRNPRRELTRPAVPCDIGA